MAKNTTKAKYKKNEPTITFKTLKNNILNAFLEALFYKKWINKFFAVVYY
jgi:hypothetical protein